MPANVDDPWQIDDLSRRLFLNLFDNQVGEVEQYKRRQRRLALVSLFDAVLDSDRINARAAAEELVATIPFPVVRAPAPAPSPRFTLAFDETEKLT